MHRALHLLAAAAALILLAIAPRLPLLLAPVGDLHFVGEELHRGTTAKHWMEGPVLPLADYQFVTFHGGPFVSSAVAVPLFAVFGQNRMALKATGLVFHAVAILMIFACLARLAGLRAAWFGALLLAGTPPGYAILNLIAFGTHVEANALALGALLAYLAYLERPGTWRLALLGLVCGFGVFFTYTMGLTVGAICLHALFKGHLRSPSALGVFAAAGAVGFAPWLYLNLRNGLEGLRLYGGFGGPPVPLADSPEGAGARLVDLLTYGLPRSSFFADLGVVPAAALDSIYALLLALGLVGLLVVRPRASSFDPRFLLFAPLLFLVGFAVTGFGVGRPVGHAETFRYVYLLYPILILGLALGADRLAGRGVLARRAVTSGVVTVALLCSVASLQFVDRERLGADAAKPGYDNHAFGRFTVLILVQQPEKLVSALSLARERMEEAEFRRFQAGMAQSLFLLDGIDLTKPSRREFALRARAARSAIELLEQELPWWADGVPRRPR